MTPSTASQHCRRLRLLARIQRRYEILTEPMSVGPMVFHFTRVADPNRVLDQIAEAEDRLERETGMRLSSDQLGLPYWAELWDSALGMAQHLIHRAELATAPIKPLCLCIGDRPASVLDLGCGMGFTGTVAAALGAGVLLADLEPAALMFAEFNASQYDPAVRTRRLNWQTAQLGERFDLILGADILYERKQWEPLERFWRGHLAVGGAVLLGEPGRQTGDDFVPWIQKRNWRLTRHAQHVPTRSSPIRLFELKIVS